jgi:hypothetical protein
MVIKSDEWSRPGGCKNDTLSFTVNRGSIVHPKGSVTICQALTLDRDSPWTNWRLLDNDDSPNDEDGPRVVYRGTPGDTDAVCDGDFRYEIGDRVDFAIRLKGSGDGKEPTTVYIGKGLIGIVGCD